MDRARGSYQGTTQTQQTMDKVWDPLTKSSQEQKEIRPEARLGIRLQGGSEGFIYLQCGAEVHPGDRADRAGDRLQHSHSSNWEDLEPIGSGKVRGKERVRGQRKQQGIWAGPQSFVGALWALTHVSQSLVSYHSKP